MRFIWKVLLVAIPVGGYWLYKKSSSPPADTKVESDQAQKSKTTSQSSPKAAKQGGMDADKQEASSRDKEEEESTAEIIERLADLDGVTSRVAENLVERGIKSKEALLKLSEEELKSIKGIGPKRAAKIINLE